MRAVDIIVYEPQIEHADQRDLVRFNKLCKKLALKNIQIKRYALKHDKDIFVQNEDLWHLIYYAGIENLPATYINGKIAKIEEYPTIKDIKEWISLFKN